MKKYLEFSELNRSQLRAYRNTFRSAFPQVILDSEIVLRCWQKVETYFSYYQRVMIDDDQNIMGFINMLPFRWEQPATDLPAEGWDWLMQKGIRDYEDGCVANCLGGLQVVVSKKYLGMGLSKELIKEGKRVKDDMGYRNLLIPIRPTLKHKHPCLTMDEYIRLKQADKVYDPWIRTHLKSGAKIIKTCERSMTVKGDLNFWKGLIEEEVVGTGYYRVPGALNLVYVDVAANRGEYQEENIWIRY